MRECGCDLLRWRGRWGEGGFDFRFRRLACDFALLIDRFANRTGPTGEIEQHDRDAKPGEDVFLALRQTAEDAMASLRFRKERRA